MVKEEIIAGIQNGLSRGQTLEQAMQTFLNSGYNESDVKEAAHYINMGAISNLPASPQPSSLYPLLSSLPPKISPSPQELAQQKQQQAFQQPLQPQQIPQQYPQYNQQMQKPRKRFSGLLITLLIMLIILIGILVSFFLFGEKILNFFFPA